MTMEHVQSIEGEKSDNFFFKSSKMVKRKHLIHKKGLIKSETNIFT